MRAKFVQQNLHVHVSERFLAAGMNQPVDETAPLTDNILGTSISGTGHTVAKTDLSLVPSLENALLDMSLIGHTTTRTVGYNGPAAIYASGTTQIMGKKRIIIDANGFSSKPATASASTKTNITGINAGGAMAQRIATNRVYESKPQAEQIGASHAAARVRQRMEAQVDEQLRKSQASYLKNFRNPFVRRRQFPAIHFSTSEDALSVDALQADRFQLAASEAAPNLVDVHDVGLRLHESLVNNAAAALLAGVTLKEKEVQDQVIEWRGELPEQLKSDEDKDPWSITFAKVRPVTVKFSDDGVKITVRGQRYTSGDRDFQAMDVTADYKVTNDGGKIRLVRDENLQIAPPNFTKGKPLLTKQVTLKTLLQKKFGKLFEPEIKADQVELSDRWEKAGPLDFKQLQSHGGWLVIALLQSAPPPDTTDKVAQ